MSDYRDAIDRAREWTPVSGGAEAMVHTVKAVHRERRRHRRQLTGLATVSAVFLIGVAAAASRAPAPTADRATNRATAPTAPPIAPTRYAQLGPRVMVSMKDDARFVVRRASDSETLVDVVAGTIAFRLHEGPTPHRLITFSGEVEVSTNGAAFSMTANEGTTPRIVVVAGQVEVQTATASKTISSSPTPRELDDLFELLATAPTDIAPQKKPRPDQRRPIEVAPPTRGAPADLWRQARLMRGQGRWDRALELLRALEATRDPEWEPMAELEQMRIYESVLLRPQEVARLGARFLAEHPSHSLRRDATEMTCRAQRQLEVALDPACN